MADQGGHIRRRQAIVLAAALMITPLGAQGADLVMWWEEGFYPQEDEAAAEIIAAFEQATAKQVELACHKQADLAEAIAAALEMNQPPDFAFGTLINDYIDRWAFDDGLVDSTEAVGHFSDLFDPDALRRVTLLNQKTRQQGRVRPAYGPISQLRPCLEEPFEAGGFRTPDIPKDWEAFWSFWCDPVQPAVRRGMGREDVWGVGLPMSITATADAYAQVVQFMAAYDAEFVTPDGGLVIDDPAVRQPRSGAGRRPRGLVGAGILSLGGRSGRRDCRRLRAEDR